MSTKISPPDLTKSRNYESYKNELLAWKEITSLENTKQGIFIALSLPEDHETGIRSKVFDELALTTLKAADGLDKLIEFLDGVLGKDDLTDNFQKYEDFEDCVKQPGQSMNDFILEFDRHHNKLVKLKMNLEPSLVAFKLIKAAKLTKEEKLVVLTGLDYDDKPKLYEQAKKSLKKYKGVAGGGTSNSMDDGMRAIKLEPAFLAQNEEALAAAGYTRNTRGGYGGQHRGGRGHGGSSRVYSGGYSRGNWRDRDGKIRTCNICGSQQHFMRNCPQNYGNRTWKAEVNNNDIVLMCEDVQCNFIKEAVNCAVLDTACSSTIAGKSWFETYISTLDEVDKAKVLKINTDRDPKTFKFGGGETLFSLGQYTIPAYIAGKPIKIEVDVVKSDVPLLLSLRAMKKASVKLDLANDAAEILGVDVLLNRTASGHYCIPIVKDTEVKIDDVFAVRLEDMSDKERYNAILKLHRQFAHPTENRFVALLKDAGAWKTEFQVIISQIYHQCKLCQRYRKTPARPAVAMSMASRFNELVSMDLKTWDDRYILHLVDMWSRYSVSIFIYRKKPSEVVDKIMIHWVAIFGVMGGIMHDNGGEFSSDETREVASILDVKDVSTGAYSPFQNGLNERNHHVTDLMLTKLVEENKETHLDVLLAWANMAKNSLQMWHGFSSHQLVFGENPHLPNIMTDAPPSLQGSTTSEMLAHHLNALHAARKAFIQSETSERIRRALKSKMRASEERFENGDIVYYKRDKARWLGPGKVVFQDSKVVFVRHGGKYVTVSANFVRKATGEGKEAVEVKPVIGDAEKEVKCIKVKKNEVLKKGFVEEFSDVLPEDAQERENVLSEDRGEEEGPDSEIIEGEGDNGSSSEREEVGQQEGELGESEGEEVPGTSSGFDLKKGDRIRFIDEEGGLAKEVVITGRGGKKTGVNKNYFNVKDVNDESKLSGVNLETVFEWKRVDEEVNLVLIPRRRHSEEECVKAKLVELEKLKSFNTYIEVEGKGQYSISTTWVMWNKGDEVRARLVARGFEEIANFPKDSPTIQKSTIRIIMLISACKKWVLKTTDIKSAFLQSRKLDREVYIQPPKEANVPEGHLWLLQRGLYGLNDAARQFFVSVTELLSGEGCQQSVLDPSLFVKRSEDGHIVGIVGCHVDDFMHCGFSTFDATVMTKLTERFLAGKNEEKQFKYTGFNITQDENTFSIILDMEEYIKDIDVPSVPPGRAKMKLDVLCPEEQKTYRKAVGMLNWIVQGVRPDKVFDLVELSTKLKSATVSDLVRVSKVLQQVNNESGFMVFHDLGDPTTWRMVVFTDASLANLSDGCSSMGANLVMVVGSNGLCAILSWHANKLKRVVRSTLAAEMLSLEDGLEEAICLRDMIEWICGIAPCSIPIEGIVDNKSTVEAIHSTKAVQDKLLRINVGAVKEFMDKGRVNSVRWCESSNQLANCMTKKGAPGSNLLEILQTGIVCLNV